MGADVERGHLLLADISGYTAFLSGTELEHATVVFLVGTWLVLVRTTRRTTR